MLSDKAKTIRRKLAELFPLLNERQRRLVAAAEARDYGHGGVSIVAHVTGMSRQTIHRGMKELGQLDDIDRVRISGAGRKKIADTMPELLER